MGLIRTMAALPVHIKAIIITVISLVGFWMIITPIYLEILALSDTVPVYGWMAIGVCLILFAIKFGKVIL